MNTFAEGWGDSQCRVLRRQVDGTGADDWSLLPVHHQGDPNTHTTTDFVYIHYTSKYIYYYDLLSFSTHNVNCNFGKYHCKSVHLLATVFNASKNSMYLSSSSKLHLLAKMSRYCLFHRISTRILYSSATWPLNLFYHPRLPFHINKDRIISGINSSREFKIRSCLPVLWGCSNSASDLPLAASLLPNTDFNARFPASTWTNAESEEWE